MMSDYPPSPPSRATKPSRIKASSATDFRYELPITVEPPVRPRPGGLAARSPPPRRGPSRQNSDTTIQTVQTQRPGRAPSLPGGSVFSGREGSVHALRLEAASPKPEDLNLFAHHCQLFYFSPNPPQDSSAYISKTLASLPAAQRAAYTRLQSTIRSQAHLHHLRLRITSFHALISSTVSSASLTPRSRADPRAAKKERKERLGRFISTYCTRHSGVEPFFKALWALLRVQSRAVGGAGGRRVAWEVDDAVFMESGGAEFMHEAIDMLKGVLGFTDQALTPPPRLRPRTRGFSDPFGDGRMPLSPNLAGDTEVLLGEPEQTPLLEPELSDSDDLAAEEADLNKPRFRIWTFPAHINNQEAESLLGLFPLFSKQDVRFPFVRPGHGLSDIEREQWTVVPGLDVRIPRIESEDLEGVLRHGTGRMWCGLEQRSLDWQGGGWFRFVRWLKRLFGMH